MPITVNYLWPVTATPTTPPNAAQSAAVSTVIAGVTATADADTTAVITHNLGIPAADLAAGFPVITITGITAPSAISLWRAVNTDGNTVTLTKSTTVGSGGVGDQIRVSISRPHTIVR